MSGSNDNDVELPNDEMDRARYEYPPGLMPDSEGTYLYINLDDGYFIYNKDSPEDEYLKSNVSVHISP